MGVDDLGNEKGSEFCEPAGVGAEDVALAGFEEVEDTGFVDYVGATVVGNVINVDAVVL